MSKIAQATEVRPPIKTPQELVHIKHKISLRQYKYWLLMLRAYREAYELKSVPNEQGFYRIPISTLEEWLGYELVRKELRDDLESIRREPIMYNLLGKDGKKILRGAGFVSEWELSANWIGFKLPSFLMESIEQLDLKTAIFQKINWEVFNSFTGKYEAVLYKLCRDYVGCKQTPPLSIQEYREYMGIKEGEYAEFKDLNKFVISAPIKRINESAAADIEVEAIFTRAARKIVAVKFIVTPKSQTMLDLGDDPAFRFSRVTIALLKQKEYLAQKSPTMIEHSIQRANEYGDEQDAQGKEVNFGALYRKAIEEDWGQEYQSKKVRATEKLTAEQEQKKKDAEKARKKRIDELQDEFKRLAVTSATKALSLDARRVYAQAYADGEGQGSATSYNAEKGEFSDKIENVKFSIWLRIAVAPAFDPVAFATWLKTEKSIDPKKIGV